jgi:folate-binding protein YgfZ
MEYTKTKLQLIQEECALITQNDSPSFFLSGEDVRRWCNGMFSNNIRALPINKGNRSGICNPKGHVQGLLDTYCLEQEKFLIVLDGLTKSDFTKRFGPYMMLDDIELSELQDSLISLQGPKAQMILESLGYTFSEEQDVFPQDWGYIIRKDRFGSRRQTHGFDIISSETQVLRTQLEQAGVPLFNEEAQEAVRILSGKARFPNDFGERAFFHELLLNEECCSFNKGCYIGQEIINRMDVKGLVNKRLQLYSSTEPFAVGEKLYLNDKTVGDIRSICTIDKVYYGLAMVRKKSWNTDIQRDSACASHMTS